MSGLALATGSFEMPMPRGGVVVLRGQAQRLTREALAMLAGAWPEELDIVTLAIGLYGVPTDPDSSERARVMAGRARYAARVMDALDEALEGSDFALARVDDGFALTRAGRA